jgi:hypothetical protein
MMKDKNNHKKPQDPDNNNSFTPNKDASAKEVIQSALSSFLKEKIQEKNITKKNLESLIGVVEEFLSCFIVLGYTFDGTPINYICAHTQQEADSLATLVNKFYQNASLPDEDIDE